MQLTTLGASVPRIGLPKPSPDAVSMEVVSARQDLAAVPDGSETDGAVTETH